RFHARPPDLTARLSALFLTRERTAKRKPRRNFRSQARQAANICISGRCPERCPETAAQLIKELKMERTRTNELLKNFDGKHWRSEPDNRQVRHYFPIRVQ